MMPQQPPSKQASRLIVLGLIVPCLLISIPAFVAYRTQHQLADSFHWVSHTIEVQRQLERFRSLLLEAESNQRGFLLGSRTCYEAYQSALKQVPPQIGTLRALTADNPVQQENLRYMDPLVAAKLDFMAQTISLQQHGQHEAMLALISTDRGKQTMDAIRSRLEAMEQEESHLLTTREEQLSSRARLSTGFLFALVALNLLFTLAMLGMLRRLSKVQSLITMCAWSHTVEYEGEWLSFEQYLLRRFNLNTSHGISPAEAEKAFGSLQHK
jgi:CHASE3 domain sensor protein